ncbi:MAG: hypothetical protein ABEJ05_12290 [Haloglomus sp.]
MADLDDLAITMGKLGEGPWELTLEDGKTLEVELDAVEVSEQRGFHAAGRDRRADKEDRLVELSTGPQPGGTIQLERRALSEDEWEDAGEVVAADKQDHV